MIQTSIVLFLLFLVNTQAAFLPTIRTQHFSTSTAMSAAADNNNDKPFAVIVQAEIQPDRMAEFMELIEKNAVETRKEPGCIRFDVLRSQESPNQFFFYELYQNAAAIDHHKKQPHYNLWADFKAGGGTVKSTSFKTDGEFLT